MEIRERIAMIERGMVPPPEADPVGFEAQPALRRGRAVSAIQASAIGAQASLSCPSVSA